MCPLREEKMGKGKFARIGKYKYITGKLAFIITGGHTAGLIYGWPYVSQVLKINNLFSLRFVQFLWKGPRTTRAKLLYSTICIN